MKKLGVFAAGLVLIAVVYVIVASPWNDEGEPTDVAASATITVTGSLHDAAKDGDIARLRDLISAGVDLEAQDKYVGTALHWAALSGNVEAAEALIKAGANVNSQAKGDGTVSLHLAAQRGHMEIIELLIANGAEVDARDSESEITHGGRTPLHYAANAAVAQLLLLEGADVEAGESGVGRTPLFNATMTGNVEVMEVLVAAGAKVNAKTPAGETILHIGVLNVGGNVDGVVKLLELGADVNGMRDQEPVFGETPLGVALRLGIDNQVKILRAAGASE